MYVLWLRSNFEFATPSVIASAAHESCMARLDSLMGITPTCDCSTQGIPLVLPRYSYKRTSTLLHQMSEGENLHLENKKWRR